MAEFLTTFRSELIILAVMLLVMGSLIILVPQLLRARLRRAEMLHLEHLKAIERGQTVPVDDDRNRMAARLALLVPMVVMIAAATVTCFIAMKGSEHVFTVTLAVWVVAGTVSLAAITGGVALLGRLAHLESEAEEEEKQFSERYPP
jgi:hypothetical protein